MAQDEEAGLVSAGAGEPAGWKRRWTMLLMCYVAFCLCNLDRVNMRWAAGVLSNPRSHWSPPVKAPQSPSDYLDIAISKPQCLGISSTLTVRLLPCSIAILPISKAAGWDSATVGLVQSSFFW